MLRFICKLLKIKSKRYVNAETYERKCRLCNSTDIEVVIQSRSKNKAKVEKSDFAPTSSDFGICYDLVKCNSCKSVFALLDDEEAHLNQHYCESRDDLYLTQGAERSIGFKKIISHLKHFVPDNGRLLDIGCSYGLFLKIASRSWQEAYGVELSKDASRYAREIFGLNVFCGDIKEAKFTREYFDIITVIEVIEHIADPKDFIATINRLLKPGGILYLVTPDVGSISARLMGERWWSYRKMHLNYFSKDSISGLLVRSGFSVLDSRPYKKTFKLEYIKHQLYSFGYAKVPYYILSAISNILKVKNLCLTASLGDIAVMAKKDNIQKEQV